LDIIEEALIELSRQYCTALYFIFDVQKGIMQTKLSLRMDDQAVAKVKRISKRRNKSVSKMIEEYINEMPEESRKQKSSIEIPQWIQQLGGGKKPRKITGDPRLEYLTNKYLK
jgi:predicted transcriptional regulator